MQGSFARDIAHTLQGIDDMFEKNKQSGWTANTGRIVTSGDGFALEKLIATTDGIPRWERVTFNRNKQSILEAAIRAGLTNTTDES